MMNPQQHMEHMEKVEQGLQAILASEDIGEIKAIAQSLLGEESAEKKAESVQPQKESFEDKYAKAVAAEQGGAE